MKSKDEVLNEAEFKRYYDIYYSLSLIETGEARGDKIV